LIIAPCRRDGEVDREEAVVRTGVACGNRNEPHEATTPESRRPRATPRLELRTGGLQYRRSAPQDGRSKRPTSGPGRPRRAPEELRAAGSRAEWRAASRARPRRTPAVVRTAASSRLSASIAAPATARQPQQDEGAPAPDPEVRCGREPRGGCEHRATATRPHRRRRGLRLLVARIGRCAANRLLRADGPAPLRGGVRAKSRAVARRRASRARQELRVVWDVVAGSYGCDASTRQRVAEYLN